MCGLAAIFYCYEYLLRIIPSVMIPQLMASFEVTSYSIGSMSAFYYYAYTPAQMPVGLMLDKYGARYILTMATLLCALGTLIFGQTDIMWIACMSRFIVGFGSAFAFVGVLKLATNWLPPERFALVSGLATTLGMLGAMYGKIHLAHMVNMTGWESAVMICGYVGLFLAPIIWLIVRNAPSAQQSKMPKEPSMTYYQLLKETKLILSNGQVWLNGIIGCLFFLPTSVFAELWGDHYLESVYGLPSEMAAKAVSMIFLGWAVGGPLAGWLSDHLRRRKLPLQIGSIISAVLLGMLVFQWIPVNLFWIFGILFSVGFFSGVEVICFAIGKENCSSNVAGTAIATTNLLIMMGGVIFQPLIGKALDVFWDNQIGLDGIPIYSAASYQKAMLILPVALMIAFLLSFCLKETHCKGIDDL
jgi:sugar phosphate permease